MNSTESEPSGLRTRSRLQGRIFLPAGLATNTVFGLGVSITCCSTPLRRRIAASSRTSGNR